MPPGEKYLGSVSHIPNGVNDFDGIWQNPGRSGPTGRPWRRSWRIARRAVRTPDL